MGSIIPSPVLITLVFLLAFVLPYHGCLAFGAGQTKAAVLKDVVFRHGDIETILVGMKAFGGYVFTQEDYKVMYFGNWLRDFSQFMDITVLSKQWGREAAMVIVMILGFRAFGKATGKFDVTYDELGVYQAAEHIDNPKGYGKGCPDDNPSKVFHQLRGKVLPEELEIDPSTGMKNYIARAGVAYPTSSKTIKEILLGVISNGRQWKATRSDDYKTKALRGLGRALHTLEDFSAHSNFVELALLSIGYDRVFSYVGDNVSVKDPKGRKVPPLVTGSFGATDLQLSLAGELKDKILAGDYSPANRKGDGLFSIGDDLGELVKKVITWAAKLGLGDPNAKIQVDEAQRKGTDAKHLPAPELRQLAMDLMAVRDTVEDMIDKLLDRAAELKAVLDDARVVVNALIDKLLQPFLEAAMSIVLQGTADVNSGVNIGARELLLKQEQSEIFTDANVSDPTHSRLAKDHYENILNGVAGEVSGTVLTYTVTEVIKAWDQPNVNAEAQVNLILEALFHPAFQKPGSVIQQKMLDVVQRWVKTVSVETLKLLEKDSVRDNRNNDRKLPAVDPNLRAKEIDEAAARLAQALTDPRILAIFTRLLGEAALAGVSVLAKGVLNELRDAGVPVDAIARDADSVFKAIGDAGDKAAFTALTTIAPVINVGAKAVSAVADAGDKAAFTALTAIAPVINVGAQAVSAVADTGNTVISHVGNVTGQLKDTTSQLANSAANTLSNAANKLKFW